MFLQYIDFIFVLFRAINNKMISAQTIRGNFQVDINQSKAMVRREKQLAGEGQTPSQRSVVGAQAAGGQPQAGA